MNRLKSLLYVGIIITIYLVYIKYGTFYFFKYALPALKELFSIKYSKLIDPLIAFPGAYSFRITWMALILLVAVTLIYLPFSRKLVLKLNFKKYNLIPWGKWNLAEEYGWVRESVKELATAAGIPEPKIYIYESPAPNAFAIGGKKGYIVIHIGLLNYLSSDEVKSILAHEIGHLKQGWTHRSLLSVAFIILNTMSIIFRIASLIFSVIGVVGAETAASSKDDKDAEDVGGGLAIFGIVMASISFIMLAATVVTSYVMLILNRILERSDEYDADIRGARLAKPDVLATALNKLENYYSGRYFETNPVYASFYTINPLRKGFIKRLLNTHPSTHKRVKILNKLHEKNQKGTAKLVMFKLKDALVIIILAIGLLFVWKKTGMAYAMKYITMEHVDNVSQYFSTDFEDASELEKACQQEFNTTKKGYIEMLKDSFMPVKCKMENCSYDLWHLWGRGVTFSIFDRLNYKLKHSYADDWGWHKKFHFKQKLLFKYDTLKKIPLINKLIEAEELVPVGTFEDMIRLKSFEKDILDLSNREKLETIFGGGIFYDNIIQVFSFKQDVQLQQLSDKKYKLVANLRGKFENMSFVEFIKRYVKVYRKNLAKFYNISESDIKIVPFDNELLLTFFKNRSNKKQPWEIKCELHLSRINKTLYTYVPGNKVLKIYATCKKDEKNRHMASENQRGGTYYSPDGQYLFGWVPVDKPIATCSQRFEFTVDIDKLPPVERFDTDEKIEHWRYSEENIQIVKSPLKFKEIKN